MELILALILFLLVFAGLALGLMLSGRPPLTACDGLACRDDARCAGCPRRAAATAGEPDT